MKCTRLCKWLGTFVSGSQAWCGALQPKKSHNAYTKAGPFPAQSAPRARVHIVCAVHNVCSNKCGPIFLEPQANLKVVGVSFAVEASITNICANGAAYLVFNEKMHDFVKSVLANQ